MILQTRKECLDCNCFAEAMHIQVILLVLHRLDDRAVCVLVGIDSVGLPIELRTVQTVVELPRIFDVARPFKPHIAEAPESQFRNCLLYTSPSPRD